MPTTLTASAIEKGTYFITVSFIDEDGNAVTPNAGVTWTLTDSNGVVINNRKNVGITEAASVDIVLSGDDLQAVDSADPWRKLLIEGTYDSDAGDDLPFKDEVKFPFIDLAAVS
jgi:hypothetical protein